MFNTKRRLCFVWIQNVVHYLEKIITVTEVRRRSDVGSKQTTGGQLSEYLCVLHEEEFLKLYSHLILLTEGHTGENNMLYVHCGCGYSVTFGL